MDALDRIAERLEAGDDPAQLAASLVPRRAADALWWTRRLPLFCEHPDPQVAGVARVVATRAMRRHGLAIGPDGRVAPTGKRLEAGKVPLACDGAAVAYTAGIHPGKDHYQFAGDPIPFTGGGHYSHFADADAVAALGGPGAYLAKLVEALEAEREKEFEASFREPWPEVTGGRVKKPRAQENTLF